MSLVLTQAELGGKLGMSLANITRIEGNKSRGIYLRNARALAEAAGVSFDKLVEMIAPTAAPIEPNTTPPIDQPYLPPQWDLNLSAGPWQFVDFVAQLSDEQLAKGIKTYRVRLFGDSMAPQFPNGCVVEFERVRIDEDRLIVGSFYYVHKSSNEATFKQLIATTDDGLELRALNKRKYPEKLFVPWQDVANLGRACMMSIPEPGETKTKLRLG